MLFFIRRGKKKLPGRCAGTYGQAVFRFYYNNSSTGSFSKLGIFDTCS